MRERVAHAKRSAARRESPALRRPRGSRLATRRALQPAELWVRGTASHDPHGGKHDAAKRSSPLGRRDRRFAAERPHAATTSRCCNRRNGAVVLAVSGGCFIAAPIATSGAVTGVGDRINTHAPSSRRQPRWPAIGWTPLVLWNTQKRLSGPVHRRRWMPMRSGAAEGVGDGRRPAPVQIDHGGRRGPFSGL